MIQMFALNHMAAIRGSMDFLDASFAATAA
jgi:hypothetical protein